MILVLMAAWMHFWVLPASARVGCDALPAQAPATISVIPSASVRGVDVDVFGGLDAGGTVRVVGNAAACCGDVNVDVGAACSSADGATVLRQVSPWLLWVEVFWHLLPDMTLSVLRLLTRVYVTELLSSPVT